MIAANKPCQIRFTSQEIIGSRFVKEVSAFVMHSCVDGFIVHTLAVHTAS